MQTIYAFSYNHGIATGTNSTGTNWRMAYQQPVMLYKGTTNFVKIIVFSPSQQVVNISNYEIEVQLIDKESKVSLLTKTVIDTVPEGGVGTIEFTENDLETLDGRFYHIVARLTGPNDGSSIVRQEILYIDDNYGAHTPVIVEDVWNFPTTD
jgi:hypothetical protein